MSEVSNYSEPADKMPVYVSALDSALRTDEAAEVPDYPQEASRQGLMLKPVSVMQVVATMAIQEDIVARHILQF